MKHIDTLIDKIPQRVMIIFSIGLLGGVLSVFLQLTLHKLVLPALYKTTPRVYSATKQTSQLNLVLPKLTQTLPDYEVQLSSTSFQLGDDEVPALAYVVTDFDSGDIVTHKNADKKVPIASLTKLMTAMVALDLAEQDEVFTVSESAAKQIPTKIGVVAGQKMSLSELLHALLMTSANDAAAVIEEGINNKYEAEIFVAAMNRKAEHLGLTNTHFTNPQGFDHPRNHSTASDLAKLAYYSMSYDEIADIVKKEYVKVPHTEEHKQFDLYNWNGLIGVYPNTVGFKIGNTERAGKTTIVLSKRANRSVLAVLLGADDVLERDLGAARLLDVGYTSLIGATPVAVTTTMLKEKYASWEFFN